MSKQERILTEEDLKEFSEETRDLPKVVTDYRIKLLINSHRSLMDANAALSFENMRLKGIEEHAIKRIKAETAGNERLDKQVEELQTELAAEKAASEIWRRKLHKEAKPND